MSCAISLHDIAPFFPLIIVMKKKIADFFKFDEVIEFRNTLDEETDRGVALMAASFIESELEVCEMGRVEH